MAANRGQRKQHRCWAELHNPFGIERCNWLYDLVSQWSLELGHSLVIGHWSLVILSSLFFASPAHGEDQTQPTIQSMIGGWLFSPSHSYMTESEVRLPL